MFLLIDCYFEHKQFLKAEKAITKLEELQEKNKQFLVSENNILSDHTKEYLEVSERSQYLNTLTFGSMISKPERLPVRISAEEL